MMVVVECRRPRCWSCKQLGHIAKFCPQKEQPATTTVTVAATQKEAPEKSQDQAKSDEGWKEVTRKKGKKGNFPKATVPPPSKEKTPSQEKSLEPELTPAGPVPVPMESKSPTKPPASSPVPPAKTSLKKEKEAPCSRARGITDGDYS